MSPSIAAIFGGAELPVILPLLVPLLAGVIVVSFDESPAARTVARLAMIAATAGAGFALARTLAGDRTTWQGFVADPWRALLASGALLVACAFMTRGTTWSRSAIAVTAGAGSAALLAPDALWLGILLPATTAAYAVAAAAVADSTLRLRAVRSTVALVVSDLAAVLGLILAAGDALTLPPISGAAPGLLLAAGAIRLGLAPAATEDAIASGLGAAWLGPVRAQGALLAGFAVARGGALGTSLAALGATMAAAGAWRAYRERVTEPLATVAAGVVAAGLGLGGPAGATGAVLALAGSFAAWPVWLARRADGAAVPTFALAPAGATFAGAVMISGSALQAGAVNAPYLAIAAGLLVAAPLAAVAAWRAREPEWKAERVLISRTQPAMEADTAPPSLESAPPTRAAHVAQPADDLETQLWESEGGFVDETSADDQLREEAPAGEVVVAEAGFRREVIHNWVDLVWVVPAILVLIALVAQPGRVRNVVAVPAAAILGAGRLLGPDPFGVDDTLGVIMAVLAVLGLAAASGARAAAAVPSLEPPRWSRWWLAPAPAVASSDLVRRWGLVAAIAGAATVGLAARLLLVASSRGFL